MSNRAFLGQSDESLAVSGTSGMFGLPTPDEHDILFGSSYELPVLWGSLFTRDDILFLQADVEDPVVYPALCSPADQAIERSIKRLASIEPGLPGFRPAFDKWRARLGRAHKKFLVAETIELWDMGEEFGDELERLLDSWSNAHSHSRIALIKKAALRNEPAAIEEALIGYSWLD